jgi:hypothetical protein
MVPMTCPNGSGRNVEKLQLKFIYKHLSSNGLDRSFGRLWMPRIPFKITIWLSLILHNAISTKDNMTKQTKWETHNASFVIRRRQFCTLNVQPLICMVSGGDKGIVNRAR